MDANMLKAGESYSALVDTYVIFITENDVIGGDEPIYHIERKIRETGADFGDGSHIIYVNGSHKGSTPLGRLMHDFYCRNADDMNYSVLAERMRYLKEDEGGVFGLSKIVEEYAKEYANEKIKNIALKLISIGTSFENIVKVTGLSPEEVEALVPAAV